MKIFKILLIVITFLSIQSCGGVSSGEITNKEEYTELKNAVNQCKADLKSKEISEEKYVSKMEGYGDIYVKSVNAIPPERRYRVAIFCYKEALKYDKKNKNLKKKLQEQQKLFQVVNQ